MLPFVCLLIIIRDTVPYHYHAQYHTTHEKLSRKLLTIVQVSFVFVNLLSLT